MRSDAQTDSLEEVLAGVRQRAGMYDQSGDWPAEDLIALAAAGAMRWAVPAQFGGSDVAPLELHLRYEQLAAASLATALVLSQRDSAVGLIDASESWTGREAALRELAGNEYFATIGIAQLTTSRQGGPPALRATTAKGGYRLRGVIPWATGAGKAAYVIAGAVLEDNRQILFALPMDLRGVKARPPMPLVALRASWTTGIDCEEALLESRQVMRGPVEAALAGRKKGLGLGQAFLATGLCRGALDLIAAHDSERARAALAKLERNLGDLRREILELCGPGREAEAAAAAPRLREECNDLAVRATHAAIALYKGTALLSDHPAQRLAREAMFLLVWSCPNPVIDCTLDLLAEG
jgi:alkylation response protein AidB-like acyl-CoA dehydrogenase